MSTRERETELIVERLHADAGIRVSSIYDLVNSSENYAQAVPALLELLPAVTDRRLKEGIVRALTIKEAAGPSAASALLDEFKRLPPDPQWELVKWAIGNALSVVATDEALDDLTAFVQDKRHGKSREMLAVALGNMRDERDRAIDVLRRLLTDDQVSGHAVIALGNLHAREARADIEPFREHPNRWVRKEAEKALKKIDKATP
jgi:HEAT repeat protein